MSFELYTAEAKKDGEMLKYFNSNFMNKLEVPSQNGFVCKWIFRINEESFDQAYDAGLSDTIMETMRKVLDMQMIDIFTNLFCGKSDPDLLAIAKKIESMIANGQTRQAVEIINGYMAGNDQIDLFKETYNKQDFSKDMLIFAKGFVCIDENLLNCFIGLNVSSSYLNNEEMKFVPVAKRKAYIGDFPPFETMYQLAVSQEKNV